MAALAFGAAPACRGEDTPGDRGVAGSKAPVLMPGRPGEQARTATPGQTVGPPAAKANAADIQFVRMMIPHHEQALEMTALVKERASDQRVRAIAGRIDAAQGPEISWMQSWLRDHGAAGTGHQGHSGHGGHGTNQGGAQMPGMATPQQMTQLRAASGKDFDRLFLQLMIKHHEGAITMSTQVENKGSDLAVKELALDVRVTQQVEINHMRGMLAG